MDFWVCKCLILHLCYVLFYVNFVEIKILFHIFSKFFVHNTYYCLWSSQGIWQIKSQKKSRRRSSLLLLTLFMWEFLLIAVCSWSMFQLLYWIYWITGKTRMLPRYMIHYIIYMKNANIFKKPINYM